MGRRHPLRLALFVSVAAVLIQRSIGRQANAVPVLIDLFKEHRGSELAEGRRYIVQDLKGVDLSSGLSSIPESRRDAVRDLMWFYGNLGALVAHRIVDIRPVSGYLGGAALAIWERLERLVEGERRTRSTTGYSDSRRWQEYFEVLVEALNETPPSSVRESLRTRGVSRLGGL